MFTPTREQVDIAKGVGRGEDIKVIAGPGTGKSSTLRYICQENKYKNFLSITFNKANAVEAEEHPEKPLNVEYKTSHGLAYREIVDFKMRKKIHYGFMYQEVPEDIAKDIIMEHHREIEGSKKEYKDVQKDVTNLIRLFCNSDAETPEEFVKGCSIDFLMSEIVEFSQDCWESYTYLTKIYWELLVCKDSGAKITHDVYLKLFQLKRCKIQNFDAIMVDEFQDTNPCFVAILKNNTHLQQIFVGDPAQSLYAFRGAKNCFKDFDYKTYYLSTSFRFSPEIAEFINKVQPYTDSPLRVVGAGEHKLVKSMAFIARTNGGTFSIVADQLKLNPSLTFYTPTDMGDIFNKLFHLQSCFFNQTPQYPNKELATIRDKDSLIEALQYNDEVARLHKLGEHLRSYFKTLAEANRLFKAQSVKTANEADFIVSTIHKFKGLEADKVTIAEDFISFVKRPKDEEEREEYDEFYEEEGLTQYSDEEIIELVRQKLLESKTLANLLYVAVSRPRTVLELPYYLELFFKN